MKLKPPLLIILFLLISGLAIYGYLKAIPSVNNQTGNQPKIEITPQFFDFGEINYGEVVEHAFKVKNLGDEILEIKRVATSCACTSAKVDKERINPKEESSLRVIYNTGAMSGAHAKGKQERIIYIKNNDPINPQIEVMIYANVK